MNHRVRGGRARRPSRLAELLQPLEDLLDRILRGLPGVLVVVVAGGAVEPRLGLRELGRCLVELVPGLGEVAGVAGPPGGESPRIREARGRIGDPEVGEVAVELGLGEGLVDLLLGLLELLPRLLVTVDRVDNVTVSELGRRLVELLLPLRQPVGGLGELLQRVLGGRPAAIPDVALMSASDSSR